MAPKGPKVTETTSPGDFMDAHTHATKIIGKGKTDVVPSLKGKLGESDTDPKEQLKLKRKYLSKKLKDAGQPHAILCAKFKTDSSQH